MDLFLCYIWKAILFGIDNRCGQFEKSEKGMYFENIRYKASVLNTVEGEIIVKLIVKKKN